MVRCHKTASRFHYVNIFTIIDGKKKSQHISIDTNSNSSYLIWALFPKLKCQSL